MDNNIFEALGKGFAVFIVLFALLKWAGCGRTVVHYNPYDPVSVQSAKAQIDKDVRLANFEMGLEK